MISCPSCKSNKAKKLIVVDDKLKCDQCHQVKDRDLNLIFRRHDSANKGRFKSK